MIVGSAKLNAVLSVGVVGNVKPNTVALIGISMTSMDDTAAAAAADEEETDGCRVICPV